MNKHQSRLTQRIASLRHRRNARGAAMVEALVVIPFFMLILAGAAYVGGFYGKRLDAQADARRGTWILAATQNCDGGDANITNGHLADIDIVDSSDLGELSASPLAALCDRDFGSVTYTSRDSHEVTGPFGFDGNIRSAAMAPCNETPIPGDVAYEHAVQFLWDAYQAQGTIPPNEPGVPSTAVSSIFNTWTLGGDAYGYYGDGFYIE
jgi:hypothetical protein